jgi:NDP-sugar pyrophosphorylase family protein
MINIVIPMAGLGTRFQKIGIDKPKPLIVVNGKTLIEHSIDSFNVKGKFIFITRDFDDPEHNKELTDIFEYKNIDYTEIILQMVQQIQYCLQRILLITIIHWLFIIAIK